MTHYESKAMPDAEIAKLIDRMAPLLSAKGIKCYSAPALVAAWCDYCEEKRRPHITKYDDDSKEFVQRIHHYLRPVKEVAK